MIKVLNQAKGGESNQAKGRNASDKVINIQPREKVLGQVTKEKKSKKVPSEHA